MAATFQPSPSQTGTAFAIMSLHKRDKIRFLQFPEEIYTAAESIIIQSWPPGLQEQKMYGESYEYKLKGCPWGWSGDQEGVGSRMLLRNLFAFLDRRGWALVTPLSHSIRVGTKDSLIFQKQRESSPTPPPDVVKSLRDMFQGMDVFQSGEWNLDSFEFKFKYAPWRAHGEATVKTRLLLLRIIELLDSHGWRSYCACKQRTESDDVRQPDTWYFVKEKSETRRNLYGAEVPLMDM